MAPPTSLVVYTDQGEYARYELDKNTVNVTVIPSTPTANLSAATNSASFMLLAGNASNLPQSGFPYNAILGRPGNTEVVSVIGISGNLINLALPTTLPHLACDPIVQQVDMTGEQITVQLLKARRNRDVVAATQTITLTGKNPASATIAFFLPEIVDQNAAPRVRRGQYFIRVVSNTNPSVLANSPDFFVSLISVDRFKKEFLHGVDQQALDTETIKHQPQLITGVTVTFVSRGHKKGWFPLSYNISDPNNCGTPVRTISWCGGPSIPLRQGQTKYTLQRGNTPLDYIDIQVLSIPALPSFSTAENLLVDREPLDDNFFRSQLDRAIDWVEEQIIMAFLEPTRVVTEIDLNEITYVPGSDIPTFVQADWDRRVDALTYQRPAPGHWINFRMPYFPLINFNTLYGKVSNVRIVDIALEWVEFHERGGFVELVPFNQEIAFNFIGLIWVESLRGPVPIPNFWNFDALVGFRDTPAILLELVCKKAAVDALTLIGQAFRPGISSQSVSRDGVSESVSYLSSGRYGIFSGAITTYNEWMEVNLPKIRGAYKGVNMLVV